MPPMVQNSGKHEKNDVKCDKKLCVIHNLLYTFHVLQAVHGILQKVYSRPKNYTPKIY